MPGREEMHPQLIDPLTAAPKKEYEMDNTGTRPEDEDGEYEDGEYEIEVDRSVWDRYDTTPAGEASYQPQSQGHSMNQVTVFSVAPVSRDHSKVQDTERSPARDQKLRGGKSGRQGVKGVVFQIPGLSEAIKNQYESTKHLKGRSREKTRMIKSIIEEFKDYNVSRHTIKNYTDTYLRPKDNRGNSKS